MKSRIKIGLLFLLVSTIGVTQKNMRDIETTSQVAQGGLGYEITKFTLSSGGGVMTSGNYQLTSTIGQIDAGHKATGGNYEFNGGFLTENTDLIFKNGFE